MFHISHLNQQFDPKEVYCYFFFLYFNCNILNDIETNAIARLNYVQTSTFKVPFTFLYTCNDLGAATLAERKQYTMLHVLQQLVNHALSTFKRVPVYKAYAYVYRENVFQDTV